MLRRQLEQITSSRRYLLKHHSLFDTSSNISHRNQLSDHTHACFEHQHHLADSGIDVATLAPLPPTVLRRLAPATPHLRSCDFDASPPTGSSPTPLRAQLVRWEQVKLSWSSLINAAH
ncbi:hypothetical protein M758_UG218800 [Ceratodon purpureus]|nr:hypothetical protein M758_UG218800 [Ceratodon purpureus]